MASHWKPKHPWLQFCTQCQGASKPIQPTRKLKTPALNLILPQTSPPPKEAGDSVIIAGNRERLWTISSAAFLPGAWWARSTPVGIFVARAWSHVLPACLRGAKQSRREVGQWGRLRALTGGMLPLAAPLATLPAPGEWSRGWVLGAGLLHLTHSLPSSLGGPGSSGAEPWLLPPGYWVPTQAHLSVWSGLVCVPCSLCSILGP